MIRFFLLVFILQTAVATNAQSMIPSYKDEKDISIEFKVYNKKIESGLFYPIVQIKNDSLIKLVRLKEYFGQLDQKTYQIIRNRITQVVEVDPLKTLLIHYIDSLPNVSYMPKVSGFYKVYPDGRRFISGLNSKRYRHFSEDSVPISLMKNLNYINFKELVKRKNFRKKTLLNYKDYQSITFIEQEELTKFQSIELVHFFNRNNGYPTKDILKEKLIKDDDLFLQRLFNPAFFDKYKTILIYPDGSYYKSYSRALVKRNENKLFKFKSFEKERRKWTKKYKKVL